jgi:hypothetical protein
MKKNEFEEMLSTWFIAASASLPFPIILSVLARYFSWIETPAMDLEPLSQGVLSYVIIMLPLAVYVGFGLVNWVRSLDLNGISRGIISKACLGLSLASLFGILPLFSAVWCLAQSMGLAHPGSALETEGLHSPWLGTPLLQESLEWVLFLPLMAFGLALLSFGFRWSRYAALLAMTSFFTFCVLLLSHYWLID